MAVPQPGDRCRPAVFTAVHHLRDDPWPGVSYTSTAITTNVWHDYLGNQVTPPAGTRYEILAPRPNYAMNFNIGSWNIRVTNCEFFANWSDQCSVYGGESQIIGNYIHDGEDAGITVNAGDRHLSPGTGRHQGPCACSFTALLHATGNAFQGGGWTDPDHRRNGGPREVQPSAPAPRSPRTRSSPTTGSPAMASQPYGLVLRTSNDQSATGTTSPTDNVFGGHAVADIWLTDQGYSNALGVNEIHAPGRDRHPYSKDTVPQKLFYAGTGTPALPANRVGIHPDGRNRLRAVDVLSRRMADGLAGAR